MLSNRIAIAVRQISKTYDDPLSIVWLHAAARMGMQVARSPEVNASWNGGGILTIGTAGTLDPDDSLAQMILHEACHALVEGPESLGKLDWGLENNPDKKAHEHACLRLQAAFADQVGMRAFFASTTVFRAYYDALPANPLAEGDDPAVAMAQAAWQSAHDGPWGGVLSEALRRTAQIARALDGVAPENSLWRSNAT